MMKAHEILTQLSSQIYQMNWVFREINWIDFQRSKFHNQNQIMIRDLLLLFGRNSISKED